MFLIYNHKNVHEVWLLILKYVAGLFPHLSLFIFIFRWLNMLLLSQHDISNTFVLESCGPYVYGKLFQIQNLFMFFSQYLIHGGNIYVLTSWLMFPKRHLTKMWIKPKKPTTAVIIHFKYAITFINSWVRLWKRLETLCNATVNKPGDQTHSRWV